jgi:hypothetical protein
MSIDFSNLQPNFKSLTQSKVNAISDIMNQIKPKIDELLSDAYIHKYHIAQVKSIRTSFDKVFMQTSFACKSFVRSTSDASGGYINRHSIQNYRYYM